MDPLAIFPASLLALIPMILALTFGVIWGLTQAGLPSQWSYLAAIGVGAIIGGLTGLVFFGVADPLTAKAIIMGAFIGLGTQTASRRPAERIVTDGVAKLGTPETQAAIVVTTPDPAPPGSTTIVTTPSDPKP